MRFQDLFHSPPGFFSPFPHGTSSLSVNDEYLALEDGPPYSDRITRVPPYFSSSVPQVIFAYGAITRYGHPFQIPFRYVLCYHYRLSPISLATTFGISFDVFSSSY